MLDSEQRSLAQISAGAPLGDVLETLLVGVEAESRGGMMASILLLDEAGEHLLHGAAPSLPAAYNEAIHGVEIGPSVGSCGTAAYFGHPIYVTDIASDPLWVNFKDLALSHGLRACWSTPIEGADGKLLGTFAIYHLAPRGPTPDEVASINMIIKTTAQAIERQRAWTG
ncbi:MAG: GAF domain-containing protein [Phenylobacterium sp.]|nr:MAG: GAF domain-containing protein [Phenylobacterium sp.]